MISHLQIVRTNPDKDPIADAPSSFFKTLSTAPEHLHLVSVVCL